jgi:salicylate hydroxylase
MFIFRLKVLSLVGLADFASSSAPHLAQFCDRSADGTEIGTSDIPLTFQEQYGQPGVGVKRTALNLALKNALIKENINVIEGWKLDQVIEQEDHVVAISSTGDEIEGSFLIGCDGIKAVSRTLTLAKHNMPQEKASYTGLTQVLSPPFYTPRNNC